MAASRSAIEWTEATWNPVTGCDKVRPGCAHCYAETFAERWRGDPVDTPTSRDSTFASGRSGFDQPLRWRRPRMIFVNSMSDLFHEGIPLDVHPRGVRRDGRGASSTPSRSSRSATSGSPSSHRELEWPPNVWMGVSIENRRFVQRADYLREVPAAVRFISGRAAARAARRPRPHGIDWLIAGGESGHRHGRSRSSGSATSATDASMRAWRSSSSSGAGAHRKQADASSTAVSGRRCRRSVGSGEISATMCTSLPKNRNERQFEEYREWQWCKHTALRDYIVPWSSIVGSTSKEIYVADMFAGAGSYDDEVTGKKVDGSPVIFARRARDYNEQHPGQAHARHLRRAEPQELRGAARPGSRGSATASR